MLSFAILTLPPSSVAISSSAGEIIRQGPHHSAQKSTTTGSAEPSTSLSNEASVTFSVAIEKPLGGMRKQDVVAERRNHPCSRQGKANLHAARVCPAMW
jgi:hypothetical protein